jgi:CubicO group peptidase (beta-lactamase class C family)
VVYDHAPFEFPAAGLNSTVLDVARWMTALETSVLLSRARLETMWTAVHLPTGQAVNYGLGWALDPTGVRGYASVGHEGGGRACLTHYRAAGLTVIALAQAWGVHIDTLVDGIAGLYLP